MEIKFQDTVEGRTFFQVSLPRLIKAIENLSSNVEKNTKALERIEQHLVSSKADQEETNNDEPR